MNFDQLFEAQLDTLREDGNYRVFADLERRRGAFPKANNHFDGRGNAPFSREKSDLESQ